MVSKPAPGSIVLAEDEDIPVQAFRWGESVWGVQFHPEMTTGIVLSIIDELEDLEDQQKEDLKLEAQNPHDGLRLLANFADICRKMRKQRNASSL
jgi:GMP synthase (glutamine-hydrolysing)